MKKWIAFLLCITLLWASCAMADGFTFRDGVHWGMSKDEVTAIEGASYQSFSGDNGITLVSYNKLSFSNYTASLIYVFNADKLVMAVYGDFLTDDQEATGQILFDTLESMYGPAIPSDEHEILTYMRSVAPQGRLHLTECFQFNAPGAKLWMFLMEDQMLMILYGDPAYASVSTFGL